ncbi:hypothetical protein F8568_032650 [Actinomadura sp. LD22]|uniref:Uncharacterized protein n=1 Tax=Actinomadura physcomitrii TaxID=2650748 RepID=A0A6I4MNK6_9ACTN|nr:hypothetical protein [Actinomadura physcomitrii]MWA05031.1 hypothetical protein [Actinomadura physcomitrii]
MAKKTKSDPADRGPGASSGREELPHERIVPGNGSAAEGYESREGGGVRDGNPIAGVEMDDDGQ